METQQQQTQGQGWQTYGSAFFERQLAGWRRLVEWGKDMGLITLPKPKPVQPSSVSVEWDKGSEVEVSKD